MQLYRRMTYEVRCQIFAFLETKMTVDQIAMRIGFDRSSIYREIGRNSHRRRYLPDEAHSKAKHRRERCRRRRKLADASLLLLVKRALRKEWSPQQISNRIAFETELRVSHQTIYREIKNHRCDLRVNLRRFGRRPGRGRAGRRNHVVRPAWRRSYHDRPQMIQRRKELGHWERDTMFTTIGRRLIVCLERKTRYIKIEKVKEPYTATITEQTKRMMRNVPLKSFTNDNGNEFMDGSQFEVPVYYCDPHAPHQKGSVENVIGLLRQYIPRGSDLNRLTKKQIRKIQHRLNHRPRKCLGYKTPYEVMFNKNVALVV